MRLSKIHLDPLAAGPCPSQTFPSPKLTTLIFQLPAARLQPAIQDQNLEHRLYGFTGVLDFAGRTQSFCHMSCRSASLSNTGLPSTVARMVPLTFRAPHKSTNSSSEETVLRGNHQSWLETIAAMAQSVAFRKKLWDRRTFASLAVPSGDSLSPSRKSLKELG